MQLGAAALCIFRTIWFAQPVLLQEEAELSPFSDPPRQTGREHRDASNNSFGLISAANPRIYADDLSLWKGRALMRNL